ncbi:FAD binding domain-containing protein [Apiospora rasikravindrae]|uniref:FAD binding domain-containing protein n=1 Tax=Apiospora rasikravindrae TaxID=990691 RepID=A0ABR1SD42_9PEZI
MTESLQTSVIILGGSIVGLSSALFLAQRGVPCILIERHPGSSPHPPRHGLDAPHHGAVPDDPAHASLDDAGRKALIRHAIGSDEEIEILAQGTWALWGSIADAFADKSLRAFLAGDAAHALPPNRGGYGANTGIADAHNLVCKLEAVLAGRTDRTLLGTYDAERRAVALVRHDQIFAREDYRKYVADSAWLAERRKGGMGDIEVLDDVAMELGQIYRSSGVMVKNGEESRWALAKTPAEWKGQPGTRAPHIWVQRNEEVISSLDLFCAGWVLLSEDGGLIERLGAVAGLECVLVGQDVQEVEEGNFEAAFGVDKYGAVLVRPDGYIAARWGSGSSAEDINRMYILVSYAS